MSIHSKDGATGLTKLERIGMRAKRDINSVFNNIGHVLDKTLLREQYEKLDGRKAIGIDGISKTDYGNNLNANLENLIRKIRNGTYKPKPSRLVEIPKEDGSTRPLAISCTEDKLVQSAVHAILSEIDEPKKSRLRRGMEKLRELMRDIRHHKVTDQAKEINQVLRGHYAYYGLGGNYKSLWKIYRFAEKYWHKMLCSRSQKSYITWDKFNLIKERHPIQLPNLKLTFAGMQAMVVL